METETKTKTKSLGRIAQGLAKRYRPAKDYLRPQIPYSDIMATLKAELRRPPSLEEFEVILLYLEKKGYRFE